jgi:peptide/nickel transport system permease protein
MAPDLENPRALRLFAKGWPYRLFGIIPTTRHFIGTADGTPLHILGTDKLGRDILSRGIIGSRISLMIALSSVFLITVIGTLLGITSGYIGGQFDLWFQRFVEIILAFPQLPLYLTLATLIPVTAPSSLFLTFVVLVIVALGWAQLSREVRGKTMAMARIDYVRAAMAIGAGDTRIITRHILPNVMSHVIVAVTLGIPTIVLLESFLGFLGFAVKPPLISWGLMLQDAGTFSVIGSYPWILSPVGFVLLTVFAFNALGDGLRDAIDPY